MSLASTEILGIRLYFVDRDDLPGRPRVPVGYPLQDTEVLLVDNDGKPTPQGEIGEMVIRSPYLAVGTGATQSAQKAVFLDDLPRYGNAALSLARFGPGSSGRLPGVFGPQGLAGQDSRASHRNCRSRKRSWRYRV